MHVLLQIDLALKYKYLKIGFNNSHNGRRREAEKKDWPTFCDIAEEQFEYFNFHAISGQFDYVRLN